MKTALIAGLLLAAIAAMMAAVPANAGQHCTTTYVGNQSFTNCY